MPVGVAAIGAVQFLGTARGLCSNPEEENNQGNVRRALIYLTCLLSVPTPFLQEQ